MALSISTAHRRKRVPVRRNCKFFGEDDFSLEMDLAREYMEGDAGQTVILYRVDLNRTQVNDIYHEAAADGVRFLPPVEIPVVFEVSDAEMKAYESKRQKGIYSQIGKLVFSVLLATLEEYGCDISRGDYIGVQVDPVKRLYFTVTDDGRTSSMSNKYTLYGTVPYARRIECAVVDNTEFQG